MRVLFFVSEYDRFNGGQRSLRQLLIELPKSGIIPIVIFPANGRCYQAYIKSGIDCRIVEPSKVLLQFGQHLLHMSLIRKIWIFLFSILPYSFRLWKLMKEDNINVLHCNTSRSLLIASVMPKLMGKKIIWHVRGELNGLSATLKSICENLSTSIWLVAAVLTNQISSKSISKTFVIYNGVSPDSVPDISNYEIDVTNKKYTICTFAAITPFKGYHHLIDAINIINSKVDPEKIDFLAIGDLFDQEYILYLQDKLEEYNITNFKFIGWQDDPFYYYAQADLIVLPTVVNEILHINDKNIEVKTGEGLPRTILEAMYLQKLIISTIVAGSPEQIVHNESGFLVEPGNAEQLANTIIKVLELTDSKKTEIKKAAGDRARKIFDAYKLSLIAARKIKLLA